jgi:DNA-binding beta-propeller fold protein YncE
MVAFHRGVNRYSLLLAALGLCSSLAVVNGVPSAYAQPAYLRLERTIDAAEFGISQPEGLTFSPAAGALLLAATSPARVATIGLDDDAAGELILPSALADLRNLAFDARANRLLVFDPATSALTVIDTQADGTLDAAGAAKSALAAGALAPADPQGMAFDTRSGRVFILDAAAPRIISLRPDTEGGPGGAPALEVADLRPLGLAQPRGIAFNPQNAHLYVLDQADQQLYELADGGQVVSTRDLGPLELGDLRGMVFAPSGDPTDDPAALSLYLLDVGQEAQAGGGRIAELALAAPALAALPPSVAASLVQIIHTSRWSPPSPDPAGLAYLPPSGRLLVADSEVEEMPPYFRGVNLFETTRTGALMATASTLAFSNEPTGVAVNPANGHRFFSHDGNRLVVEVSPGPDARYGTADDTRTSFSTRAFGCRDPEGLAFGQGVLFIADGVGKEIYIVAPGPNARFDGVAPAGDDRVSHFDTSRLGQPDPEGVEFNQARGTLFMISNDNQTTIVEATLAGAVVQVIDVASLGLIAPGGLTLAPGSRNPALLSLYIAERGIDNNTDPRENDGRIYELALSSSPQSQPLPAIYLPLTRR